MSQPHDPAGSKSGSGFSSRLSAFAGKASQQLQSQLSGFSVNEIPHNLRAVQAQYDPRQSSYTLKLQLLIKAHKGVIIDTEALGREDHSLSKALYLWSKDQTKAEDLQDVGDRLAFLTFKTGDLQLEYAKALEAGRIDLKDIRNFENDLTKNRDQRKALETQIAKLRTDPKPRPDHQDRIATLSNELATAEHEGTTYEEALEVLKRRKLHSSFKTQFAAMRELGEKLALLAGYGDMLLEELDLGEEGERLSAKPYAGKERTAWIRGAAAESLAQYAGPLIEKPTMGGKAAGTGATGANISRTNSDTRYFGESHHQELANLPNPTGHAGVQLSDPARHNSTSSNSPFGDHHAVPIPPSTQPQALNHAPSPTAAFSPPRPPALPPRTSSGSGGHPPDLYTPGSGGAPEFQPPPPPPVGSDPTIAEVGGTIPTGTGGPATGQFPKRTPSNPAPVLTKAEEAAREEALNANSGNLGRMASTSRKPDGAPGEGDEQLPAYTMQEGETREAGPLPPKN